jgi:aminopeptidase
MSAEAPCCGTDSNQRAEGYALAPNDHDHRLRRFADLVVRVGVNVQPGQGVVLHADTGHLDIARAVVSRAYAAGAAWVDVVWSDGPMHRVQVDHSTVETLSSSRPWALERIKTWAAERIASIALVGDPNPHLLEGVDPARAAAFPVDEAIALQEAIFGRQLRWTVVAAPNSGWASQVYGEPDLDRLWGAVCTAMRLDQADPVAQWRQRAATLAARATALDALELTELRYTGEGTDLTVGLVQDCRWAGGGTTDPEGVAYLPNIPTEEVFTSPDRRRADGVVRVTRPVIVAGHLVTGLRVTFADGQITEVSATAGADAIRAQLDTDAGARHLGEVALVDRDSRIAKADTFFHNALFDENAACHIAWGQSFPFAVAGGLSMSEAQRAETGLNTSSVHTDIVVGGEGITVTGKGPKGTIPIIRDDDWVLPG